MDIQYRNQTCHVVNKTIEAYDVNIQRGTMWGNPYIIGVHGTRNEVIAKFEVYFKQCILNGKITKAHLETLRRMKLGCTCKPGLKCHGDIISSIVNMTFKDHPSKLSAFTQE